MKKIIPRPIHEREVVVDVTPEDCLAEMLELTKLMYNDTQRVMNAIRVESEVYAGMIERAPTSEMREQLMIQQAQAMQKPAVNPRTMMAVLDTVSRMYKISMENKEVVDGRITFVNDMSIGADDELSRQPKSISAEGERRSASGKYLERDSKD